MRGADANEDMNGSALPDNLQESPSTKRKKRRRSSPTSLRDKNAPKYPRTGYILYMVERRAALRQSEPELTLREVNAKIGSEWTLMEDGRKKDYLERAMKEKRRYNDEMTEYKKTDAYKQFQQKLAKAKKRRQQDDGDRTLNNVCSGTDVPIFTDQFLEHNRERETELRTLRREVTSLEDEQTSLRKRIDQLEAAQKHMENETESKRKQNQIIKKQLDTWRLKLADAFSHLPLPESGLKASVSTVDNYLSQVHRLLLDSPANHQNFIAQVKQVASKLKLPDCS